MTRPRAWRDVNPQFICSHSELREMWRVGRLERPAEWGPMGWFQIGYRILQAYIFFHVLICSSQLLHPKIFHAKGDTDCFSDSLFQAFERQRSLWYRSSESGCPKIDSDSPHIHHLKRHRIHTECRGHWITHFGDQTIQMYVNFDKFLL